MASENTPKTGEEVQPGWQRLTSESAKRLQETADARVGSVLAGRFQLKRILAIGGMATVYEAIQAPLMRRVAVKVLHLTEIEAGRAEYFLREANAAAALRHPNIISVVDFGKEEDGTLFLAMEYVPGQTFGDLLAKEYPLPHKRLISIMDQVCLALEVAHRAGVVHCDMKPGNIMIESVPGNPDHVKVLDFGISRHIQHNITQVEEKDTEIIGSYHFMAPEQILGKQVSAETDVYGLGVVLYTAISAAFPFNESDDQALMRAIISKEPVAPSKVRPQLDIPSAFDKIVEKALAKAPEDRFSTCAEFRKALLNITESPKSLAVSQRYSPHSLELLLPEDELFEIEIDVEQVEPDRPLTEGTPSSDFDPSKPMLSLISEMLVSEKMATAKVSVEPNLGPALTGRAPLVGRHKELSQLQSAAQMTRRGTVTVHISGHLGSGSSFFLSRGLETFTDDFNATVLLQEFNSDACEYPFRGLYELICNGLDDFADQIEGADSLDVDKRRRQVLRALKMGSIETSSITHLLDRWDIHSTSDVVLLSPETRPYSKGPLRFPETRTQLLTHAVAEMLRALVVQTKKMSKTRGQRAPLVVAIDGWEFCDSPTRQVLRQVLNEHRHLPLLFIAISHPDAKAKAFPDEVVAEGLKAGAKDEGWDISLELPPYTLPEMQQYIRQRLGEDPSETLVRHMAAASGGNPLLIKDLIDLSEHAINTDRGLEKAIIKSPEKLFSHQIEDMSREGKMLLAVCTLLGSNFPIDPVRVIMPTDFDIDGTFAELMGARVLEPVGDHRRLRFRFPQMRETSLRRLQPHLREGIHTRIVKLLLAQNLPLARNESEIWLAVHSLKAGDPLAALDHLLEAAQAALERWEPELTLRRCRQAQIWIAACLAHSQTSSDNSIVVLGAPEPLSSDDVLSIDEEIILKAPPRALETRSMRAMKILLTAARRLQVKPSRARRAIVSDRLPEQFLEQIRLRETQPTKLRAEAAFEVGCYFSRLELPQSARGAFSLAHTLGRRCGDADFLLQIELEMVRNLHRIGKQRQAVDLAQTLMEKLYSQGPRTKTQMSLSKPLNLLAKIYMDRRIYARAEHYLDQARAIAENDLDHDELCKIFLNFAALYRVQNLHERTAKSLQRAFESVKKSNDLRTQARVLYNLGITSAILSDPAKGQHFLSEAIEVAINLGWGDFIGLVNDQIRKL